MAPRKLPLTLVGIAALSLACGGNPEAGDTWLLADDSRVDDSRGGDDSDSGDSRMDGSEYIGRKWVVDLEGADIVEPSGSGALVGDYLQGQALVMEAIAGSKGTIRLRIGASELGEGGYQDECVSTQERTLDFDGLTASADLGELELFSNGQAAVFEDAWVRGDLSEDGGAWSEIVLGGDLDLRSQYEIAGAESPDELCQLLLSFGMECRSCNDGSEYCVPVRIEGLSGEENDRSVRAIGPECDGVCDEDGDGLCDGCSCSATPEPTSFLAGLLGLGMLLVLRRRDQSR